MYAELLAETVTEVDRKSRASISLVEDFFRARGQYRRLKQSTCADPCEHLVCGLRYDKALIRLSLALGAETSPNRFVCPDAERARLEGQLASLGPCLHDFIESRGGEGTRIVHWPAGRCSPWATPGRTDAPVSGGPGDWCNREPCPPSLLRSESACEGRPA